MSEVSKLTHISPKTTTNPFRMRVQERVQEVAQEYWDSRDSMSERFAVAQLILALVRAEFERDNRLWP
jgi:hypothetical protein